MAYYTETNTTTTNVNSNVTVTKNDGSRTFQRSESSTIEVKKTSSYTKSLATTQNVDNSNNKPTEETKQLPSDVPESIIDVVKEYDWTYSKNKIKKINEVPYLKAKEFKLFGNTYLSSLMTSSLLYPDLMESNAKVGSGIGQVVSSMFKVIDESFANNSFAKFMQDTLQSANSQPAVQKAKEMAANYIKKGADWVAEQAKNADNTAEAWRSMKNGEDLIKKYQYLYLRRPTGTKYKFPFFDDSFFSINNTFDDTYTSKDNSALGESLEILTKSVSKPANYLNITAITEPGMYIQRPQFYNFKDSGNSIPVKFHLFNTLSENAYLDNLDLITKLVISNTPHRHNRILVDPPCIYELQIPGKAFYPYTYISKLEIKHVGTKRMLENNEGNKTVIPDAYEVEIEFKSLTTDVNNFFIPETGTTGIDVTKRFGLFDVVNKNAKLPPIQSVSQQSDVEKPKTEQGQTQKKESFNTNFNMFNMYK